MTPPRIIVRTLIGLIIFAGSFAGYYFIRTHLPVSIVYKKDGVTSVDEWTISFGRELRIMSAALNPPVSGKWYAKNGLFGSSVLKFAPTSGFVKGETYVADIAIARTYDEEEIIEIPSCTIFRSTGTDGGSSRGEYKKRFKHDHRDIR